MSAERYTYDQLARRYCDHQDNTPAGLLQTLLAQKERYKPDGFLLAEAQLMDSSYFGSLVILPYGPNNSFKEVPTSPFTPRGLASDTSVVVAYLPAEDLPPELPASLADWQPPPAPPKKKGRKR